MKKLLKFSSVVLLNLFLTASCASGNRIKGTASDTSGTNGATNGTGKIARGL